MNTPTPDLSTLSDADLNVRFAVTFAGWKPAPLERGDRKRGVAARFRHETVKEPGCQPRTPEVLRWKDGKFGGDLWPNYCGSADAVLPYLERYNWQLWSFNPVTGGVEYWVILPMGEPNSVEGRAATFPRAAVIALLELHTSSRAIAPQDMAAAVEIPVKLDILGPTK